MFRAKISVKIYSSEKVLLEFFGTVEKNCLNETSSPPAEFSANGKLYMLLQVLIFRGVQMTKKVLVNESLLSALFWSENTDQNNSENGHFSRSVTVYFSSFPYNNLKVVQMLAFVAFYF